ncbi:MAG TPA: dihydrolipoamide acetyltransferase family protein [Steroidobacteraceae bacterium]|jgi:2-oxoisovalerate dehydrogenase E2 component (dihydrolipoyl transacylase)
MTRYVFKMPDLGEGTVAAEIITCHIKPGDEVREEQVILEVMTEKAAVEIPSPVSGRIVSIAGGPGDSVPVGADLIVFETDAAAATEAPAGKAAPAAMATTAASAVVEKTVPQSTNTPAAQSESTRGGNTRIMASPATRRRAREAAVELSAVQGSGPGGRIQRDDLDNYLTQRVAGVTKPAAGGATSSSAALSVGETEEIPVIGLRRVIAQRMAETMRTVPHFSYVEEVDVTELEALRQRLNAKQAKGSPSLTYLPFIALALARILPQFPQCNAHHDAARNVIVRHRSLHLGIATQTPDGLKVPVVRNVEQRTLAEVAAEIRRVSEAARTNKAKREELSGSTLTLTSLGKLGGIASTPIINAPEVSILGVNNAVNRPVEFNGEIVLRRMMNLSSSFDHRFVDGYDAASMIQALKEYLEHPALIFAAL